MTMTDARREALFEVAYDILSKIHSDLCHDRKFELAEELLDIMRRLILLSRKFK